MISVVVGLRQAEHHGKSEVKSGSKRAPMVFLLVILGYIISLLECEADPDYSSADRVFPVFVATVGIIGGVILFLQMMLKPGACAVF